MLTCQKNAQNWTISQITQTPHNTIYSSGSTSAPPPPSCSSTTSSSPSFLWFLSCSLQFLVSSYLWVSFVFVLGILLSPGHLNQETITLRSSRFQCLGLSPFVLAQSTLHLASALACCHLLAAANVFSSFFLWTSWACCRMVPLLRFTLCTLKAMPAIICTAELNCSWLTSKMCSSCWCRASFLAFSLNLWSIYWSMYVPARPSVRFIWFKATGILPMSSHWSYAW